MTEETSGERDYREGLVPLIVAVTGHRDLVASEVPGIRQVVTTFLLRLSKQFPDRPLRLLSPLAEGADRLVAQCALAMDIRLIVVLPMPRELYVGDFETAESRSEFDALCDRAETVFELPLGSGNSYEAIAARGTARDQQYAQLGVFLCAHSHILLAIWDGKMNEELGGTAQVVRFRRDDVMPGYAPSEVLNQQLLADDEGDLVYHVSVSRNRPGGEPADGLKPLDCHWLTADEHQPRRATLAEEYVGVFKRTSLFNQEVRRHQEAIEAESASLAPESADWLTSESRKIDLLFRAADWLAIYYQRKMLSALRIVHSLAFVMGLMFIFYSDFEARRSFILAFFVCFSAAVAVYTFAARRGWHSKYLEYRALAEGLRIQFFWAVGGVTTESATKYSHDNFLQRQDVDLGWIRNVMRVAGIGCDIRPNLSTAGLNFVLEAWIGEESRGGQLGYYRAKTDSYKTRSHQLNRLAMLVNLLILVILIASIIVDSNPVRGRLFVILGSLILMLSVRQSFLFQIGERELIKQYEFMYSIFRNARGRIRRAASDIERRRILRVLGESALDEHAQWIFLHRDRKLEAGSLLRMD